MFKKDRLESRQLGQLLHAAGICRHHLLTPCSEFPDGLWDFRILSFLGSYRAMAGFYWAGSEAPFEPDPRVVRFCIGLSGLHGRFPGNSPQPPDHSYGS